MVPKTFDNERWFYSNPTIKMMRRTLQQIEESGDLKDDKTLVM